MFSRGGLYPRRIENLFELVGAPGHGGEYYVDLPRSRVLYNLQAGGDQPPALTAARSNALIEGEQGAEGLRFEGIRFEHSARGPVRGTWYQLTLHNRDPLGSHRRVCLLAQDPSSDYGFVDQQAGYHYGAPNATDAVIPGCCGTRYSCSTLGQASHREIFTNYSIPINFSMAGVAAAVHFRAPHDVSFVGCSFHSLGGSALWLDAGAQNCSVTRCTFSDVSGGAVILGGVGGAEDGMLSCGSNATRTHDNTIQNCTSSRTAVEYHGVPAITVGYSMGTVIAHNEIANTSYSGISLGWGWGSPSYARDNVVHSNHIHHHMCGELRDGGGCV
jgi:hypothetical protein